MDYVIKRYDELTADEVYEILKIRTSVFIVEQNCPYQDVDGVDRRSYHLMCMDGGTIAGYLRIIEKTSASGETAIGRVLVIPEYRGGGVAKKMMETAKRFITETLVEGVIKISAQTYLVKFYGDLGFEAVGDGYLEDNIPHIKMVYKHD